VEVALEPIMGVVRAGISLTTEVAKRLWSDRLEKFITEAPLPAYLFNRKHVIIRSNRRTESLVGKSILGQTHAGVDRIFFERIHFAYREHWVEMQKFYGWQMQQMDAPHYLHHPTFIDNRHIKYDPESVFAGKLWNTNIYLTNLGRSGLLCIICAIEASDGDRERVDSGLPLVPLRDKSLWIPRASGYWRSAMIEPFDGWAGPYSNG
jgi:hypothetical protein